ncbi:MAG: MFS transporter [Bacillota bacterium]|nr:MFS transporter [Bacillota bacterium]
MSTFNYKKIFLLGLGFFSISLLWQLYDFYVPLFLRTYIDSQFQINAIMTFDNILAVSLIPYFAALSDRTHTRFGRRMPYLMIGIPLSAIFFTLLPNFNSFLYLVVVLFLFNLTMAVYRAPTIALMPDITPQKQRSKANGIINFMGGLASVLVFSIGAILYEKSRSLPFSISSVLIVLSLILLFIFIKEPIAGTQAKEEKINIRNSLKEIKNSKHLNTFYILGAIFAWFLGYQGVLATFSNYTVIYLNAPVKQGSFTILFFALFFLIFAIPSGFIGTKFGKKKTIEFGIIGLILSFLILAFIRTNFTFLGLDYNHFMMIFFAMGGINWALININSYPLIIDQAPEEKVGTYTGLYYFASSLAAIIGPLLMGFIIDILGFGTMFFIAVITFVLAYVFIKKVH